MAISFLFLLGFTVPLLLLVVYWIFSRPRHLPPGPTGLPLIGTLILEKDPHLVFTKLAKKYGPVFCYYSYGTPVVVLTDRKSIQEVVVRQGDKVRDRPQIFPSLVDSKGNYGLLFSNGETWSEQRRFSLSTLRDFGFGKPILEKDIMEEVDALLEAISKTRQQPTDLQFLLNNAVSNVICQLVFGRRFDYEDEEFFHILNQLNHRASSGSPVLNLNFRQWHSLFIPKLKERIHNFLAVGEEMRGYIGNLIEKQKNIFRPENEPENYIQAFLKRKQTGRGSSFHDQQLLMAVSHLFEAGTETTSTTMRWALLHCIRQPDDIQERVFQELESVVGLERPVLLADRSRLPFTDAVLLEALRMGNLVPLFGRRVLEDIRYNKFQIPANSIIFINTYAVHMDPHTFENPEQFRPDRFLDSEGKIAGADQIFPFGAGKRKCLGEGLARMELFLFFANLIQRFRFKTPSGDPTPSLDSITGITRQPKSYRVIAESRNSDGK